MESFYTPEEIATQLKIHVQTVLNYIKDGKLKAVKLEKGYRISASDFNDFVYGSRDIKTPEDRLLQLDPQKKYKSLRKTSIEPVDKMAISIPNFKLDKLLEEASVKDRQGYRAYPFPALSLMAEDQQRLSDGVLFKKESIGGEFFFSFASTRGKLLTAESLWEDANSRFENSIGLLTSIGIMYRGLLFIPRYYSMVPFEGEVNYSFSITNPSGRKLSMDSDRPVVWYGNYISTTEEPIIVQRKIKTSITSDEVREIVFDMVKEFLWYFKCELREDVIKGRIEEIAKNIIG